MSFVSFSLAVIFIIRLFSTSAFRVRNVNYVSINTFKMVVFNGVARTFPTNIWMSEEGQEFGGARKSGSVRNFWC